MKRLTPLTVPPTYIDRYITIRDGKRIAVSAPLAAAHLHIERQFGNFVAATNAGTLQALQANAHCAGVSAQLRACYNGKTKALAKLKKDIRHAQPLRQLKYCPMCGITLPGTFDHYVPAVRFPEFAVMPINLVPCCSECNSIKDDDWLTATGARIYLHAYSDEPPEFQYLFTRFNVRGVAVGATYQLRRPRHIQDARWDLIQSHYDRLRLLTRYSERSNDEIAEIVADCRIYQQEGGGDCADFLSTRAAERRSVYGLNHWVPVLMDAMAAHPNLPNWIST